MATFENLPQEVFEMIMEFVHRNAGEPTHPRPNMAVATRFCKDRRFINLVFVYGTGGRPFRDRFSAHRVTRFWNLHELDTIGGLLLPTHNEIVSLFNTEIFSGPVGPTPFAPQPYPGNYPGFSVIFFIPFHYQFPLFNLYPKIVSFLLDRGIWLEDCITKAAASAYYQLSGVPPQHIDRVARTRITDCVWVHGGNYPTLVSPTYMSNPVDGSRGLQPTREIHDDLGFRPDVWTATNVPIHCNTLELWDCALSQMQAYAENPNTVGALYPLPAYTNLRRVVMYGTTGPAISAVEEIVLILPVTIVELVTCATIYRQHTVRAAVRNRYPLLRYVVAYESGDEQPHSVDVFRALPLLVNSLQGLLFSDEESMREGHPVTKYHGQRNHCIILAIRFDLSWCPELTALAALDGFLRRLREQFPIADFTFEFAMNFNPARAYTDAELQSTVTTALGVNHPDDEITYQF